MFDDSGYKRKHEVHVYSKDNARLMWFSTLEDDDQYYRTILQVGDKNVSDVSYLHYGTMATRDINKNDDEGGHYASHVLIQKTPDQFGNYLILLEKIPGINLATIKAHFGWVCDDPLYKKDARDEDGNIRQFRPVFEIFGHQSRKIKEALRSEPLQDIEFISHEENHDGGLDGNYPPPLSLSVDFAFWLTVMPRCRR
jgi:hypothetical protein